MSKIKISLLVALALCLVSSLFFAFRLFSFNQKEDVRASYSLFKEGKYSAAISKLTEFATAGDEHAQLLVAKYYALGLGGTRNKLEAEKWLSCVASRCIDGKAELSIGLEFIHATLTEYDLTEACYWMQKSKQKQYRPANWHHDKYCEPDNTF